MQKRLRSGTRSQDAAPVTHGKKLKLASHSTGPPIRQSGARITNEDYSVGWICAINTEHVAAKCFLDERHEGPDQVSTNDNNTYTLGMIGKHHVVIAALPLGEYGVASAATVARDMVHTFPNIRIGLMVGVGGGAPGPGHDIRLGDVVVGVPRAGKGGVCQYDFGKAIQGQGFKETGYLNQPPPLLRTAVSGLIAQYEIEGHKIRETIDTVLERYPRLPKKYKRPNLDTDRLYMADIAHPLESNSQCTTHCGTDQSFFKDRPERDQDMDSPTIHYGLIASANTLMEDAVFRDLLVKENGVLCFETEAAGLMNHFPCLVIRGICDYSDSHRNDEWQGYAAMTAAAYAADLLRQIPLNKVEAERKISEILDGLHEIAQEHLEIAKEQLQVHKDQDRARFTEKEEKCHQLFRLANSEKDATYEWYKGRIEERVPDTCLWFLKHKDYQKWLKQKCGPLLVTADPGCGKSVLAKYLIDEGLPRSETICYFFFKDQDQNTIRQALCAVLHQLFSQKPSLIKHAIKKFSKDGSGLANSTESLWKVLESATSDPEAGSITIVLDALDECAESELPNLLRNLDAQFSGTQQIPLRYLLTCRPYEQIVCRFRSLFTIFPNVHIPGEEESEAISQEVNRVIAHRVNSLSKTHQLTGNIKSHLEAQLRSTSNRTYLWVHLVFKYLESTGFKQTETGIDMSISKLPMSVNEAYEEILNRSADRAMVRKALSIILASTMPLTISQMNIAMNVDFKVRSIYDLDVEDDKSFISRLRSWCGLFISIHHGKLYFLHQTAREFLLRDSPLISYPSSMLRWHKSITTYEAHTVLAELCILYIDLSSQNTQNLENLDNSGHPWTFKDTFLQYSVCYWAEHFRKACIEDDAAILSYALKLYDSGSVNHKTWNRPFERLIVYLPGRSSDIDLCTASYLGHTSSVKLLIKNGKGINEKDKRNNTPLHYASRQCSNSTVKLLLKEGADLEAKDDSGQTPLFGAIEAGATDILELLLDGGANIKTRDNNGQTPLSWAASDGDAETVELLLSRGADLDARDNRGRTPLSWAAGTAKNIELMKLLLLMGAGIEIQVNKDQTPLSWAAATENTEVIELLLGKGADLDARDNEGQTPLFWAVKTGNTEVIELLLSRGADIDVRDNEGQTSLSWAATTGITEVIELLLSKGADLDARDNEGQTPLFWAAADNDVEIMKLLLKGGANIEIKDNEGRTPLYWAAGRGCNATIRLLLEGGGRIDIRDWDSETQLDIAKNVGIDGVSKVLSRRSPIILID